MPTKEHKLRFWCQKVLPAVYDDALSYYELLAKVVKHLNDNTDATNQLIDFVTNLGDDIEDIIQQMIDDGELDPIIAETLGAMVAKPYDPTKNYEEGSFVIYDGNLYMANDSTTGEWDSSKWDEVVLSDELEALKNIALKNIYLDTNAGYIKKVTCNNTTSNAIPFDVNPTNNKDRLVSSYAVYQVPPRRRTDALRKHPPTVSFIFDDGHANDASIKTIFDSNSARCGFAVYAPIADRYVTYDQAGYEILAHASDYPSPVSEQAIINMLETAYNDVVTKIGHCYGWVTPSSLMTPKYRYLVNNYFLYGYTQSRGSDARPARAIMTERVSNVELWRTNLDALDLSACKDIINYCVSHNAYVCFYGHGAHLDVSGYHCMNSNDLDALIKYCIQQGVAIQPPLIAVRNLEDFRPFAEKCAIYGTVTYNNVVDSSNISQVKRIGNIVDLTINANSVTWEGTTAWEHKFTIPLDFAPEQNIPFLICEIETATPVSANLLANGMIQIYPNSNVTRFRGHITYITTG